MENHLPRSLHQVLPLLLSVFFFAGCTCDPEALTSHAWELEAYGPKGELQTVIITGEPIGGGIITLQFDDEQVFGKDGCNNYFGPYSVEECHVEVGNLNTTLIACEQTIMDQGAAYRDILQASTGYKIKKDKLRLRTDDHRLLVFKKQ